MKIAIIADKTDRAKKAKAKLEEQIKQVKIADSDVIIVLGGDGFMLETLHNNKNIRKPFFGLNCGSVGFLMNSIDESDSIIDRIKSARETELVTLIVVLRTIKGEKLESFAINDVSLLRASPQATHLSIEVNGIPRMGHLVGDGVLLATPAGSTAYNLAAQGSILPLESKLLALTPLNTFRPRRWRGALLPQDVDIKIKVLDPGFRPVQVAVDHYSFTDIAEVNVSTCADRAFTLLFDDDHNLHERVIAEQFL